MKNKKLVAALLEIPIILITLVYTALFAFSKTYMQCSFVKIPDIQNDCIRTLTGINKFAYNYKISFLLIIGLLYLVLMYLFLSFLDKYFFKIKNSKNRK